MGKIRKIKKLSNITKAVIKHTLSGFEKSDDLIYANRILTCLCCNRFDEVEDECLECGCPIKDKANWFSEECPLNKWEK